MLDIKKLEIHIKKYSPAFLKTILFSTKRLSFLTVEHCGFCQIVKWKTCLKFSHADSRRGCDYHLMKREIIWTMLQNSNCYILNNLHKAADQTLLTCLREVWVSASATNMSISERPSCHQNMVY